MPNFIYTEDGSRLNISDISSISGMDVEFIGGGGAKINEATKYRIDELLGTYHPNHHKEIFFLQECYSLEEEGYYFKLKIIGWVRCRHGEMLPVFPHGGIDYLNALYSNSHAILDADQGLVYTNQVDIPESEVITLHMWEERTGLRPYCPPQTSYPKTA